jgi:predicted choloylglycine hydrolase
MHMYRMQGTHYQIGVEYGIQLRAARIPLPQVSQTRLKFAARCEPHVRDCAPELFDEIAGMAEGSGYDAARLTMIALGLDAHPACSAVAVAGQHTAEGRTLMGRNHDWYYGSLHYASFLEMRPAGAIPSLGCDVGLVGRADAINAAGVAIGITAVEGGRDHPGVMFHLSTRIVLDRCRTTAEAVDVLQRIRHARSINFLIADSSGDIAIVEAAPGRVTVIRPDTGFAAITNQFQSGEMARWEKVSRRPASSYQRLITLRQWFAARQEPVSRADLETVLSTPCPRGVCAVRRSPRGMGTIWSWTASLGEGTLYLADDTPYSTPYRPFSFGDRPDPQ